MAAAEIREAVNKLDTASSLDAEHAWAVPRPLGAEVVPYFLGAYPEFRKGQGRVNLVYHAIRFARISDSAVQLGIAALHDGAGLVRSRACGLLAFSLRPDVIPHLEPLTSHPDPKTAADAIAAIDAIRQNNHHYFMDRDHTGRILWEVEPPKPA